VIPIDLCCTAPITEEIAPLKKERPQPIAPAAPLINDPSEIMTLSVNEEESKTKRGTLLYQAKETSLGEKLQSTQKSLSLDVPTSDRLETTSLKGVMKRSIMLTTQEKVESASMLFDHNVTVNNMETQPRQHQELANLKGKFLH
jgi:hypothetical protein